MSTQMPNARGPFQFELITGGHSNITYRMIDAADTRFVLRRPPLGTQPSSAHDMAREYRIQSALRGTAVPVPRVEVLCEDSRVIGAPFYVMRYVEGTVIDSPGSVAATLAAPAARRAAADDVVKTLWAIHGVDVDAVELGGLGLRNDFVARQTEECARHGKRSEHAICRSSTPCTSDWYAIGRHSGIPVWYTMTIVSATSY